MGFFSAINKRLQDNWCKGCKQEMFAAGTQLYIVPMTVGHYVSHKDAAYYLNNLRPIMNKSQIPTGYYACDGKMYQCPRCGQRVTALRMFLPVRDAEKSEETVFFRNGEVDSLPGLFRSF